MSEVFQHADNSREHRRMRTDWLGRIAMPDSGAECRVLNVSAGGAMVTSEGRYARDQHVALEMEYLGEFTGTVVWCEPGRIGIRFDSPRRDVARFAGSWSFYKHS
jgi:PilZ domain-containing protein